MYYLHNYYIYKVIKKVFPTRYSFWREKENMKTSNNSIVDRNNVVYEYDTEKIKRKFGMASRNLIDTRTLRKAIMELGIIRTRVFPTPKHDHK